MLRESVRTAQEDWLANQYHSSDPETAVRLEIAARAHARSLATLVFSIEEIKVPDPKIEEKVDE
jgi:hypothetical protein